jgi:DNA repair exonuclease SbcCD nuclease subunit
VLVVDVDLDSPAHPVTVESRTVGTWRFLTLRREVNNSRDIADLNLNLDELPDKDRTVVKLGLIGTLTVTDRAALDTCIDRHSRRFAALSIWERNTDIAVMPADDEFDDLGIGGFAADAVAELVETARSEGSDAGAARGALALLLRLKQGSAA